MKTAYIAITYFCNQKCRFCPCSKEETTFPAIELPRLKEMVDQFIESSGIEAVVISGGEPTLYPDFLELLSYLREKNLYVTVLSNAERFANTSFVGKVGEVVDKSKFMVTTTLHSQKKEEHEWVNQTPGSFEHSVKGLLNLLEYGMKVTVKHCINKQNETELKSFYQFVNSIFPEWADIQLCSIDYCGFEEGEKKTQMVSFPEIVPYMEEMFDCYIQDLENGSRRKLYCINMPLCAADPYYWDFFIMQSDKYSNYTAPVKDGDSSGTEEVETATGTFCEECEGCFVQKICPGTYRTAFEYYGNKIVKKYTE